MTLILTVALGAALAGFVQGLSGFGFGLTAMALWAWTLDPKLAATLSVVGSLTGQVLAAVTVRRGWDWRALQPFVAGGLAGLPLGLWLLPRLDVPLFKLVLGVMLMIVCPLMFFASRLPRVAGSRAGDALAGVAGGVMGGLGGFTGVVPTLWCTMRGFDRDRQRAIIQNFNLALQVVTFASYIGSGIIEARMLPLLAIVPPAVVIPVLLGARVYLGISDTGFRKLVLGLLAASGIALLASALPVLLARWAGG
ncbi:sulfite exporter TauE/SafE family protein [Ramlibacter sp.]|uniref:sulfite exporter TauE/SafE family protein n=1 Tax=Ramlibacter sp. TaxID=1917967 RepID=UPI0026275555|nr:sulfite exporter TauE/SafE family protein [Ramlibacter sp.]MDB5956810.1 permease [Ramlibacter sp.]